MPVASVFNRCEAPLYKEHNHDNTTTDADDTPETAGG